MQPSDNQAELLRQRVEAALKELNNALEDAQRSGLRTTVNSVGGQDAQTVNVVLLRPIALQLANKK